MVIRGLDGDLFVQSAHKYQFATQDPFPAAELDAARQVPGVASARPLYADWFDMFWKNPADGKIFLIRAFAFDPDQPVFPFARDQRRARAAESRRIRCWSTGAARRFLGMDRHGRAIAK